MFSWDDAKNTKNQHKHEVGFEVATLVFDDPLHVSRLERIENGEPRWKTLVWLAEWSCCWLRIRA